MSTEWRVRPLFVCGTFNDFQAERALLQTIVFPELAERLRERRHDLQPIDLRFGLETSSEESEARKDLLVLKVCLQEVARSRPFLLVLIGDRYGWVPPAEHARDAADLAGFDGDVSGRCVTELEIEHGVLRSGSTEPNRTFVYVRDLDLTGCPDDLAARYHDGSTERIERLKDRLRSALGPDRCRTYRATWDAARGDIGGLEAFRRMVVEDLWSDLDAHTRRFRVATDRWEDREREALNAFVHDAARDFTGREPILADLATLARSPTADGVDGPHGEPLCGVCVAASPGAGKSSLAAELVRRLRNDPSILLLAHAAGTTGDSMRVDRLLQRWIGELAEHLGDPEPAGDDRPGEELERTFARLLTRAAERQRTVIVLDALNEFERTSRARHLTWLPRIWPTNARLIATAVPGEETQAVGGRPGFEVVELDPLSRADAERIVDAVYRRYRRRPNPRVGEAILEKRSADGEPASGSPLWLELACEEMNFLDPDELAGAARFEGAHDEQLVLVQLEIARQLPATTGAMYRRMFRRAESVAWTILQEAGAGTDEEGAHEWVRCLAETIAAGRTGWRERDLDAVVSSRTGIPWSELLFASVRRAFRGHLLERGRSGQWDFYHRQLREAVDQGFGSPPGYRRAIHARVAEYLDSLPPDDPLRQTERMHHRIGAGDAEGAARLYAACEQGTVELRAATDSLAAAVRTRGDGAEWVGGLLAEPGLSPGEQLLLSSMLLHPLHDTLENEGCVPERRTLLTRIRAHTARLAERGEAASDRHLAARQHSLCLLRLGDLEMDVGDPGAARTLYEEHLRSTEGRSPRSPDPVFAHKDLSVAIERLGDLAAREGRVEEARSYFQRQRGICERLVAAAPGDPQAHAYLADVLERLGSLAHSDGDAAEAERYLLGSSRALEELARLRGEEPSVRAMGIRARLAEAKDETREARALYRRCEEILQRRAYAAPEDVGAQTAWSSAMETLGDVALFLRDAADAGRWYVQALQVRERLARLLPDDVTAQQAWAGALEKAADVPLLSDRFEEARPYYEKSFQIRERLNAMLPDDLPARRGLGLAHERLGMLKDRPAAERLSHAQRAVEIYTGLWQQLPGNEEAGRTLALGHFALAQTLLELPEREDAAREHAARSHHLLSDLRARGRRLDPAAARLLAFLDSQFGGSGRWTHPVEPDDDDAYARLNALGLLGAQASAAGDHATARTMYAQALELALRIRHPPSIVRACGSLGEATAIVGNGREGLRLLEEAVRIARDNDLHVEEGQSLDRLAQLHARLGDRDRALEVYRSRLELARDSGHQPGVALGSASIGVLHFENGEFAEAAGHLTAAAELFDSFRMWPQLAHAYAFLGCACEAMGDLDRCIEVYSQHIALCRRTGEPHSAAGSMANLSGVLYARGRRDEAVSLAERACEHLEGTGSPQLPALRARLELWRRS